MPNITQLAPDNVNAGGADLIVTVNGTHFNTDAPVTLTGAAATTTFVSASQGTGKLPAADTATAGMIAVTVTNPGHSGGGIYGGGGTLPETSNSVNFTVN